MNHEQKSTLSPVSQEQQSPDTQLTEKKSVCRSIRILRLIQTQKKKEKCRGISLLMFLYFSSLIMTLRQIKVKIMNMANEYHYLLMTKENEHEEKVMGAIYALLTLFILSACSTEDVVTNNSDPKVSVSTTVTPLTKKNLVKLEHQG